jgi:hypothetical protein
MGVICPILEPLEEGAGAASGLQRDINGSGLSDHLKELALLRLRFADCRPDATVPHDYSASIRD